MSNSSPFGQWLRQHRRQLDLTQDELASRAGCSVDSVRMLEAGRRTPSRHMAQSLARELRVPEEEWPRIVEMARQPAVDRAANAPDEPTPKSPSARKVGGSLPYLHTGFIARTAEVASVVKLLSRDDVRLVTLAGPPGIGKTRLGIEIAGRLESKFEQGVYFVPLSPLTDPNAVPEAIAQVVGLADRSGTPALEALKAHLHNQQALLVLDNFEHVWQARSAAGELLSACPHIKILVTSRRLLRIAGERRFTVPPLSVPKEGERLTAREALDYAGIALFVDRSQAANDSFRLTSDNLDAVIEICRRLDGLPLAIELAAARSKVLTPQAILARLANRMKLLTTGPDDLPPRQRSLNASMQWSYELLSEDEKALFRRMAVFAGGATLEAVETVCQASPGVEQADRDMLDTITGLLDASLIYVQDQSDGEPRYLMLWTVREYAGERLVESCEERQVAQKHAWYYMQLAETAGPLVASPHRHRWIASLDRELDNLRTALAWSLDGSPGAWQIEAALRISGALQWYWYFRGHFAEGPDWLRKAIDAARALPISTGEQYYHVAERYMARALTALAFIRLYELRLGEAIELLEPAVNLWRATADRQGLAEARAIMGACRARGDKDPAGIDAMKQAAAHLGEIGNRWLQAFYSLVMAEVSEGLYNPPKMEALCREALRLFRETGDRWGVGCGLETLGVIADNMGEPARAEQHFESALAIFQQAGDRWHVAALLRQLGDTALCLGNERKAKGLYERSLHLYTIMGDRLRQAALLRNLGHASTRAGDFNHASECYMRSLEIFRELGYEPSIVLGLAGVAGLTGAAGQPESAARLFGAVQSLRENLHLQMIARIDETNLERNVEIVREQLGQEAFDAAWQEGRAMTIQGATSLALDRVIDNET